MAGHQLVMGDVDEQVFLEEPLDRRPLGKFGDLLLGGGRNVAAQNHHASSVVFVGAELGELAHGLCADAGVVVELDPDSADVGLRIGVIGGRGRRVLLQHLGTWSSRELHSLASVNGSAQLWSVTAQPLIEYTLPRVQGYTYATVPSMLVYCILNASREILTSSSANS